MEIKIGIYCMEKDEDDILEQWILHHSKITPITNIYIIDNMSDSRKTHSILEKYKVMGLNVSYEKDYKQKGTLVYNLIKESKPDIAIPLDLDDFIKFDDDPKNIKDIFEKIYKEYMKDTKSTNGRYSFKHYLTSENDQLYYADPIKEITKFTIVDLKSHNKKFFIGPCLTGLDHGNHTGTVTDGTSSYTETDLILVHYHFRGILKLIEKCKNDIKGLKIVKNINNISELTTKISQNVPGSHNIKTYRDFLMYGSYYLLA